VVCPVPAAGIAARAPKTVSNYQNFVSDFPRRCGDLLDVGDRASTTKGREVTRLICVAMPSIIVPLERLKQPSQSAKVVGHGHPSLDWQRFAGAREMLNELEGTPFRGSQVWPDAYTVSWWGGKIADVSGDPDCWPELVTPKPVTPEKTTGNLLKRLRDALAHGSVFTRGGGSIDLLLFVSEVTQNSNEFNYLAVAPDDFRKFLRHWLEFLKKLDLPSSVIPHGRASAA